MQYVLGRERRWQADEVNDSKDQMDLMMMIPKCSRKMWLWENMVVVKVWKMKRIGNGRENQFKQKSQDELI